MENSNDIQNRINELESLMQDPDFWQDKSKAQDVLKELASLKEKKEGMGKYDKDNAIMTIISGAGGDDAEDFARMLYDMYSKYVVSKGYQWKVIHQHWNEHNGIRNISFEIGGKGAYGNLKNETGVHRLVRISPFNAKKLRHTSFSLVEVLPKFSKLEEKDVMLKPEDLKIEFARSGGPGGQNVNKRETAVRITHLPSGIQVASQVERSQERNREMAMGLLRSRLYKFLAEKQEKERQGVRSEKISIEWGSQIRSYVMHPYQMVKDHRTEAETSQIDKVLDGDLDDFIEAEVKNKS